MDEIGDRWVENEVDEERAKYSFVLKSKYRCKIWLHLLQ